MLEMCVYTIWPLNSTGIGVSTLPAIENQSTSYSQPSVPQLPPYSGFCIHTFNQPQCHRIYCWKYTHCSGPVQFKPVLFKGQLYIDIDNLIAWVFYIGKSYEFVAFNKFIWIAHYSIWQHPLATFTHCGVCLPYKNLCFKRMLAGRL